MADGRELSAIPIANLATLVVPVALMTVLVGLNAWWSAPAAPEEPPPAVRHGVPDSTPLGLSVHIEPDSGYRVVWSDEDTATERSWGVHIPCSRAHCADGFDEAELLRALGLAKSRHPLVERIAIVPRGTVSYQVVLRTAELARGEADAPLFPFAVVTR